MREKSLAWPMRMASPAGVAMGASAAAAGAVATAAMQRAAIAALTPFPLAGRGQGDGVSAR